MTSLFHQNMQNYGGGGWRNFAFDIDFAAIRGRTGAVYAVAGFTEIRNNNSGQQFANRALALDPGLTQWALIEVGITAVGARSEFLGIAWDPAVFTAGHSGVVLYNSVARRWECHDRTAPAGLMVLPDFRAGGKRRYEGAAADSRALAYVAGTSGATNCIFGFMHNMYWLGDRSSAFTALNDMRTAIVNAVGFAASRCYIGGDFNLAPRDPYNGGTLHHAAARNLANTAYLNTTAANPYDFWLSDQGGITNAQAHVEDDALQFQDSDHAGIRLDVW
jgi:hypothetical protein